jgi:hypothetical protein
VRGRRPDRAWRRNSTPIAPRGGWVATSPRCSGNTFFATNPNADLTSQATLDAYKKVIAALYSRDSIG